ncbi:MAG: TlpA disulfide reductase family protein [Gammaproteobacteria bacterium]|nr:TlpA disulfide reductase family protein [Gammaproteobacteria bacterium]
MTISRHNCRLIAVVALCSVMAFALPRAGHSAELSALPDAQAFVLDLPDLDGQSRSLDEFAGRVVLVNFWASWCTPCVREMPSIMRLGQSFSDRPFTVIGVNVAESERRAAAAAQRMDLDFAVWLDRDGDAFAALGGYVLPTTYVIDAAGKARYAVKGPLEWDGPEVIDAIERLLRETPGPTLAGE